MVLLPFGLMIPILKLSFKNFGIHYKKYTYGVIGVKVWIFKGEILGGMAAVEQPEGYGQYASFTEQAKDATTPMSSTSTAMFPITFSVKWASKSSLQVSLSLIASYLFSHSVVGISVSSF